MVHSVGVLVASCQPDASSVSVVSPDPGSGSLANNCCSDHHAEHQFVQKPSMIESQTDLKSMAIMGGPAGAHGVALGRQPWQGAVHGPCTQCRVSCGWPNQVVCMCEAVAYAT
jgi:hypothetical protein